MNKAELRKIYLARQINLSPSERKEKSETIAARFFRGFDLKNIRFLHCFVPIEKFGEIDTTFIYKKIWRDFPHVETFAPRVDFQTGEIENRRFTAGAELVRNLWDIREPAQTETVEAEKIDAVLTPLLCFDRRGFRVGYGKGFYDRFLRNARADCLKIGLSYFAPRAEIADADDRYDVKLDCCLTPNAIYRFGV